MFKAGTPKRTTQSSMPKSKKAMIESEQATDEETRSKTVKATLTPKKKSKNTPKKNPIMKESALKASEWIEENSIAEEPAESEPKDQEYSLDELLKLQEESEKEIGEEVDPIRNSLEALKKKANYEERPEEDIETHAETPRFVYTEWNRSENNTLRDEVFSKESEHVRELVRSRSGNYSSLPSILEVKLTK